MGKGSGRRPAAISAQEFAEKWAQTFGKAKRRQRVDDDITAEEWANMERRSLVRALSPNKRTFRNETLRELAENEARAWTAALSVSVPEFSWIKPQRAEANADAPNTNEERRDA